MTTVSLRPEVTLGRLRTKARDGLRKRLALAWAFILQHKIILAVLAATSVIRIWNFTGTPATWNDDEGTYVAQAYAILNYGTLGHYTYWYDHPPFGWIQIAGWAWLTDGFARYAGTAIMIGRELVAIYGVISGILVYVLCRSLRINRSLSTIAVVLFMISPIALFYGKMVFLDNLMVPWFLASLIFAAESGKRANLAYLSGLCFGLAFLTKETILPFAPAVFALIMINSARSFWVKNIVNAMLTLLAFGIAPYLVYATLKGELVEGPGHVSLEYAIKWQLLNRANSGPLLASDGTFVSWLNLDYFLLLGGSIMMIAAALKRRFWPVVILGLVGGGLIVRGGYLPSPYVIILLPIAALGIAAGTQALWEGWDKFRFLTIATRFLAVLFIVVFAVKVIPAWQERTAETFGSDGVRTEQQAVDWVVKNSPAREHAQIVVDENVWIDLINRGYTRKSVDWLYKIDADPAITPRYIPKGGTKADMWKSVDYVVIPPLGDQIINSVPTLKASIAHATIEAQYGHGFGSYIIYKVNH